MNKNTTIKKSINQFIASLEKSDVSFSTLTTKKRHAVAFLNFLEEYNLEELMMSDFTKKQYSQFSVFLEKRKIKESTKRSYMATILSTMRSLEIPDFVGEEETDLQKIVNFYFTTKGYSLQGVKDSCKKRKIIYSRYTRAAKDLLEISGSIYKAQKAIERVAEWAKSRDLDYGIETVIKKWPEINKLKPKEKKKKSYYRGDPMMWSESKKKWFVISGGGDWLEFAGNKDDIEWREE